MNNIIRAISPINGQVYVERALATSAEVEEALSRAKSVQPDWRALPIEQRAALSAALSM